jgi:hypothetical protein
MGSSKRHYKIVIVWQRFSRPEKPPSCRAQLVINELLLGIEHRQFAHTLNAPALEWQCCGHQAVGGSGGGLGADDSPQFASLAFAMEKFARCEDKQSVYGFPDQVAEVPAVQKKSSPLAEKLSIRFILREHGGEFLIGIPGVTRNCARCF